MMISVLKDNRILITSHDHFWLVFTAAKPSRGRNDGMLFRRHAFQAPFCHEVCYCTYNYIFCVQYISLYPTLTWSLVS